ncbi:MAG: hypothetical protein PHE55_06600 [Methylococcaceae bacterium]|nr:hypothetical protein [Methylococcaceae bacterium]
MFNDTHQHHEANDIGLAKKPYISPELKEYGNMEELTRGTGLVLLDILIQGSLTVSVTTLG